MGACCGGGSSGSPSSGVAHKPGNLRPAGAGARAPAGSPAKKGTAGALADNAVVEETRARARERAIKALVDSIYNKETGKGSSGANAVMAAASANTVVPTPKWRRQFLTAPNIGVHVAEALSNFLIEYNTVMKMESTATSKAQNAPASPSTSPSSTLRQKKNRMASVVMDTLDLRAMRMGDKGLLALLPGLLQDSCLIKYVFLSGNLITDSGVSQFVQTVQRHRGAAKQGGDACAMELLVLTDNHIGSSGIGLLCSELSFFRHLKRLEVGRGKAGLVEDEEGELLSQQTVEQLVQYIEQPDGSLREFVLKGTGDYYNKTGFAPQGFSYFVTHVVGKSKLEELYLQECYTTKPTDSGGLAATVFQNKRTDGGAAQPSPVSVSNARNVDMKQLLEPIRDLATALRSPTTSLSTLVLRFPLSVRAVEFLAEGLARASTVENVSLRGCELAAASLQLIGNVVLPRNRSILVLDLSFQSNLIAHSRYLADLRSSSSKRRQSNCGGYSSATTSAMISYNNNTALRNGKDDDESYLEIPSKEQSEHPLLPVIMGLYHNSTLQRLLCLGIAIATSDVEELCQMFESRQEQQKSAAAPIGSGPEGSSLYEFAYTSTGSDALQIKLDNFLKVNRENVLAQTSSTRRMRKVDSLEVASTASAAGGKSPPPMPPGGKRSVTSASQNHFYLSGTPDTSASNLTTLAAAAGGASADNANAGHQVHPVGGAGDESEEPDDEDAFSERPFSSNPNSTTNILSSRRRRPTGKPTALPPLSGAADHGLFSDEDDSLPVRSPQDPQMVKVQVGGSQASPSPPRAGAAGAKKKVCETQN